MKNLLKSFALIMAVIGLNSCENDLPKTDLHVHLTVKYADTPTLRFEKAAALSKKMGVVFGIADETGSAEVRANDSILSESIALVRKYPLYLGLQVGQPGWTKLYSKATLYSLDYIMGDALRFPDTDGQVRLIWLPDVVFNDPEDFMERYVAYNLKVLSEPIHIWANPTYLPISLEREYDQLWTADRMKILIDAAVKNNIAIEINSRFQIPGKRFIEMAKAAGARFTFGSNQHDTNIGDINWSRRMAKACGLRKEDFFVPKRVLLNK